MSKTSATAEKKNEFDFTLRRVTCTIRGTSPYAQSMRYEVEKISIDETHAQAEERTWKERGHWNEEGKMFLPAMSFKKMIEGSAAYMGLKVPGRGKLGWAGIFGSAVMPDADGTILDAQGNPITRDNVRKLSLYVPSDGKKGGSTRVLKHFPLLLPGWTGICSLSVMDGRIPEDVFYKTLLCGGRFVGLGMFRPEKPRFGYFGRFEPVDIKWETLE